MKHRSQGTHISNSSLSKVLWQSFAYLKERRSWRLRNSENWSFAIKGQYITKSFLLVICNMIANCLVSITSAINNSLIGRVSHSSDTIRSHFHYLQIHHTPQHTNTFLSVFVLIINQNWDSNNAGFCSPYGGSSILYNWVGRILLSFPSSSRCISKTHEYLSIGWWCERQYTRSL